MIITESKAISTDKLRWRKLRTISRNVESSVSTLRRGSCSELHGCRSTQGQLGWLLYLRWNGVVPEEPKSIIQWQHVPRNADNDCREPISLPSESLQWWHSLSEESNPAGCGQPWKRVDYHHGGDITGLTITISWSGATGTSCPWSKPKLWLQLEWVEGMRISLTLEPGFPRKQDLFWARVLGHWGSNARSGGW